MRADCMYCNWSFRAKTADEKVCDSHNCQNKFKKDKETQKYLEENSHWDNDGHLEELEHENK